MVLLPLLATATAAQAIPSSTQEQDLRCVAVISAIIGTLEESKRPTVMAGAMYYVGRVTARRPDLDLEAELRRILGDDAAFKKILPAEATRCGADLQKVGTELTRVGGAMKSTGQPATK